MWNAPTKGNTMKAKPRVFFRSYNNSESACWRGFEPYTDDDGRRIIKRTIELEPFTWKAGVGILIRIMDLFYDTDGSRRGVVQTRETDNKVIYDKDVSPEFWAPMGWLCDDEVSGRAAEDVASKLFCDVVVKDDFTKKYLPEIFTGVN